MKNFWLGFKDFFTTCEGSRDSDPITRDLGFIFGVIILFIAPVVLVLLTDKILQ